MKVVRWTSYEGGNGLSVAPVSLFGGHPCSLTRAECLACHPDAARPYIEAIWSALDELKHTPTGEDHHDRFTPVFDDDACARFSWRGWGDLVSAWWNDKHPDDLRTYVDFYM